MVNASAKYWHVAEAVEAMESTTVAAVVAWLKERYPTEILKDVRENLYHLSVNAPSRIHYNKARTNWRSDSGHWHDRLFLIKGANNRVRFEPFDPARHGHVNLQQSAAGKWIVVPLQVGELARTEIEAQAEAFAHVPALVNDHDARVWAMQAVAIRRGQATFRARLLEAYEGRCAITGTNAVQVLEAAHIRPYRGEHTNRLDNGLLLRADLHTLFDCGLMWIAADFTVILAPSLLSTDYAALQGQRLRLPPLPVDRPNPVHLVEHMQLAQERVGLADQIQPI